MSTIEKYPFVYQFMIQVKIQSTVQDGEDYLQNLMTFFAAHNFQILNSCYERKTVTHNRLGRTLAEPISAITVELNLQRDVSRIHSPSDYIERELRPDVYTTFDCFAKQLALEDKLNYIIWMDANWYKVCEHKVYSFSDYQTLQQKMNLQEACRLLQHIDNIYIPKTEFSGTIKDFVGYSLHTAIQLVVSHLNSK